MEVEAAVYFCCLEALQNAAKHAQATGVVVCVEESAGELRFTAADDGRGIDVARARRGSGVQNMIDRMAALGGSLDLRSKPGGGTEVSGRLPVQIRQQTSGNPPSRRPCSKRDEINARPGTPKRSSMSR